MELILGAMVVALWVRTIPAAIADMVTTMRASKAGEWGLIDKERDRKAARAEARRKAIASIRAKRNKQAGGDGTYRPGMAAYLADVYHGLWEDELEKRRAKRAARPPVGPDGKRPAPSRLDQAVEGKVRKQRTTTGYLGRAARLLIDPVGEKRQPADVTAPQPPRGGEPTGEPVDPWAPNGGGDEPTIELADRESRSGVVHDGVATSYAHAGKWAWSCRRDGCSGKGFDLDTEEQAQTAAAQHRCADTNTRPREGVQMTTNPAPTRPNGSPARCVRCRINRTQTGVDRCGDCLDVLKALRQATDAAWFQVAPDGGPQDGDVQKVRDVVTAQNNHGWTPEEIRSAVRHAQPIAQPGNTNDTGSDHAARVPTLTDQQRIRNEMYGKCAYRERREGFPDEWCDNPFDGTDPYCREHRSITAPTGNGADTSNGGTTMNTATGDVHDVETCKSECEALDDDLTRVDTALDVIDEAIRQAKEATERIEAWLREKNADACVPGMSTALDALSADRIKELIDAVAAAKQGVRDTIDNLAPLEEAAELVGDTDGSALNGR